MINMTAIKTWWDIQVTKLEDIILNIFDRDGREDEWQ